MVRPFFRWMTSADAQTTAHVDRNRIDRSNRKMTEERTEAHSRAPGVQGAGDKGNQGSAPGVAVDLALGWVRIAGGAAVSPALASVRLRRHIDGTQFSGSAVSAVAQRRAGQKPRVPCP